jgi:hypothetical protein
VRQLFQIIISLYEIATRLKFVMIEFQQRQEMPEKGGRARVSIFHRDAAEIGGPSLAVQSKAICGMIFTVITKEGRCTLAVTVEYRASSPLYGEIDIVVPAPDIRNVTFDPAKASSKKQGCPSVTTGMRFAS